MLPGFFYEKKFHTKNKSQKNENSHESSMAHLLSTSPVPRLLSQVSCLMSPVSLSCLLSHVSCLTPPVSRPLSQVSCLTSPVTCLLSQVFCIVLCFSFLFTISGLVVQYSFKSRGMCGRRSWVSSPGWSLFFQSVLKIPKLSAFNA